MTQLVLEPLVEIHAAEYFTRNRTVRRALKRWWVDPPKRWVAWLMLNPSVADAGRDDPTTRRLTHFTRTWGFDGWIAVNLYPFVASDPAEMWNRANWEANGPDWYARDDMAANLRDIEAAGRMAALRVVAFGSQPIERGQVWLDQCLEAFQQPPDNSDNSTALWCLGVNQSGQPTHPMARGTHRVPDDQKPVPWRSA